VAPAHFSWNYTTYLNLLFLGVFGFLYWIYKNRARFGAGDRYARDPVCGMQVETAHAPASLERAGERLYFCSDRCAERDARDHDHIDPTTQRGLVRESAAHH
jgi:hypothetical protein